MPARPEVSHFLKEVFPFAGAELLRLYQGAADNTNLLRSDYYTIRDWVEIGRCAQDPAAHAAILLMLIALEEGSLCIEIADLPLLKRLRDLVAEEDATSWVQRIVAWLGTPASAPLVGTSPLDHRPMILYSAGSQQFLYFPKYLRAEREFHDCLVARLGQTVSPLEPAWTEIAGNVVNTQPLPLDHDQQLALQTALRHNFAIISGGPGTGKTSIVMTLLRCLVHAGILPDRIALAAPTGRAAQRLTEAIRIGIDRLPTLQTDDIKLKKLSATTLHRLLGYHPTRNTFARHCENPVPADVVIVDEVSMVGLVMMSQLLQATALNAKLILLGDKDQLPSVEAGAVLGHLVPREPDATARDVNGAPLSTGEGHGVRVKAAEALRDRVVLLRTNHRSEQAIRDAALAINRQDTGVVERLPALANFNAELFDKGGGCWFLEQTHRTAGELRGFLQSWVEQAYFQSRLDGVSLADLIDRTTVTEHEESDGRCQAIFTLLDRFRLLTMVRETAWGCDEINEFFSIHLRQKLDASGRSQLFPGAPVLITRNDNARGLFNGDVGMTLRDRRGGLRVLFQNQDGVLSFPAESLPAHELGFALTVHKSQGSEYDNVMVVLPPTAGKRLLTKELIYTAITRAKTRAIICSAKDVLTFAISRRIVRESAMLLRSPTDSGDAERCDSIPLR